METLQASTIEPDETSIASIDLDHIGSLVRDMDAAIKKCAATEADLAATPEELASMQYKDLKRFEQSISGEIKEAEEARKTFKRKWQEPQKQVENAFKAAIQGTTELHEAYKAERIKRDYTFRDERYILLSDAYIEFLADNGISALAENVPFDRIFEKSWTNRGTKPEKAEELMIKKASSILDDYRALENISLNYPDDAFIYYFETMSLKKTIDHDIDLFERNKSLKELKKEVSINSDYQENVIDSKNEQHYENEKYYTLEIKCTDTQFNQLIHDAYSIGIKEINCTIR